jgi:hypothetical protein
LASIPPSGEERRIAVVRRTWIGIIVAIFGIAAALGVVYPAGAKPPKGHHGRCASKLSKAKHIKRRAKCKKVRKSRRGPSNGAKTVQPTRTTTSPPTNTPPTGPTGATGVSPNGSIPAPVRAELLKVTLDDIKGTGKTFPTEIQAVSTSLAKTGHATEEPGLAAQTPVYLVALRFLRLCDVPPGAECGPQQTVLELEFLASSPLRILPLREQLQFNYPDLNEFGVPVLLAAKGE